MHLWYPYQAMKNAPLPYEVVHAEGVYLFTKEKPLIDSTASWWSVIHGYNHPVLNQALHEQIDRFSHVMLGGLTHAPAEELAETLANYLPGQLNHVFFSDSGSVAVEVALKMALQYHINRGCHQRKHILALTHAYHGDTFKTMEVGDDPDYHFIVKAYGKSRYVHHVDAEVEALEKVFLEKGESLAAFIVEPLLQGAGGMRIYSLDVLKKARALCDQYGVLLIFDEVATGFGRTGHRFVADLVVPDILVLGKALTAGYIGHAATVASRKVYDAFDSEDPMQALMHGPTFMANPLACAVAKASIGLFESERTLEKIAHIEEKTRSLLEGLQHKRIRSIRIMGGMACIEVNDASVLKGYREFAYERGVFARPFLNYLYAMVPYVIDDEALTSVCHTMRAWFDA